MKYFEISGKNYQLQYLALSSWVSSANYFRKEIFGTLYIVWEIGKLKKNGVCLTEFRFLQMAYHELLRAYIYIFHQKTSRACKCYYGKTWYSRFWKTWRLSRNSGSHENSWQWSFRKKMVCAGRLSQKSMELTTLKIFIFVKADQIFLSEIYRLTAPKNFGNLLKLGLFTKTSKTFPALWEIRVLSAKIKSARRQDKFRTKKNKKKEKSLY